MTENLSVQLYTVREMIAEDLNGTLERIASLGLTQVEPYHLMGFPALGEALSQAGLTAPTAHAGFLGDGSIAETAERAAALGIGTIIDPYVAPDKWLTADDVKKTADALNSAAEVAAQYGVTVGYHNHSHEVENVIDEVTPLEFFTRHLADNVVLEIDTFWVAAGGIDPVDYLSKFGDRVVAIHVKDGKISKDTLDQLAVGAGEMPIAQVLAAAPTALRVIELDNSRGDRFQAIADSVTYLTNQKGQA